MGEAWFTLEALCMAVALCTVVDLSTVALCTLLPLFCIVPPWSTPLLDLLLSLVLMLLLTPLPRSPPTTSTTPCLMTTRAPPSLPPRALMVLEPRVAPTVLLSQTEGPRLSTTTPTMLMDMLLMLPMTVFPSTPLLPPLLLLLTPPLLPTLQLASLLTLMQAFLPTLPPLSSVKNHSNAIYFLFIGINIKQAQ